MTNHPLTGYSVRYLNENKLSESTNKAYRIYFKYYIKYLSDQTIVYATTSDVIRFKKNFKG